jgi:hypothetical protein
MGTTFYVCAWLLVMSLAQACGSRTGPEFDPWLVETDAPSFPDATAMPESGTDGPTREAGSAADVARDGRVDASFDVTIIDARIDVVVVDDPTTLGDERAGYIECRTRFLGPSPTPANLCAPGETCCIESGTCERTASSCRIAQVCDGDEDCAAGERCCRRGFVCSPKCTPEENRIEHLSCLGPCGDADLDGIPDLADRCPFSQSEDGIGPLSRDGCRDDDADGVRNDDDLCPDKAEDGLPPKPSDGCPR